MQSEGVAEYNADLGNERRVEPGPAVAARAFGWAMLAALCAYIVNVALTFWGRFPGVLPLIGGRANGDPSTTLSLVQAAIYIGAIAFALGAVLKTPQRNLRQDEAIVSAFNQFLVRAAFWIVLFVGIADVLISFLRVEGLLEVYFGEELAGDLGRARFRGPYVHVPLVVLGIAVAAVTRTLGFMWLALMVVIAELSIVLSRFVFSYEQAFMADLVRFWYGALFLFASAYTLLDDGHVRVDLFYADMRRRNKARVNKWGALLLGIPLCWTIIILGMWTENSTIIGPILIWEITQAGFGLFVKYFMAAFLGVFAITMLIQFVAQYFSAVADRRNESGGRPPKAELM